MYWSHKNFCIIILFFKTSKNATLPPFLTISSGSLPLFKIVKKILLFSFIKGNNLSAILMAAFCPLSSPSKQMIGFWKNFHINLIWFSVSAVPEFEITFLIPTECRDKTSIYPSTIITSSGFNLSSLAKFKLKSCLPFLSSSDGYCSQDLYNN